MTVYSFIQEAPTPPSPPSTTGPTTAIAEVYRQRVADFGAQAAAYDRRWNQVANLRLLLSVAAFAALGVAIWRGPLWLFWLAGVLALSFVVAIVYHERLKWQRERYATLQALNAEGLQRLQRDWNALPVQAVIPYHEYSSLQRLQRDWNALPLRQPPTTAATPAIATDLDLLGHGSLLHLLNSTGEAGGQRTLQDWLLHPAPPATIQQRQTAVAELAPLIDFRDQLALAGRRIGTEHTHYEQLLAWAESPLWLRTQPRLLWLTRLLTLITVGTGVAQMALQTTSALWLLLLAINGLLTLACRRQLSSVFDLLMARQQAVRAYGDLFNLVVEQPVTAPLLQQIQQSLAASERRAGDWLYRLSVLMAFTDLRKSVLYLPIQIITLGGFHLIWLLEGWQAQVGTRLRTWLQALSEYEALAALATLHYDHPDWVFPSFSTLDAPLQAQGIGHPLLPDDTRVPNDVTVGPVGQFVLVTGSNMSGKSTLLRAVGVNVVLAQAGAPVCATHMRLPPLMLATSIRVQDSLLQGVSYFMAEIMRLKQVIDLAQATRASGERVTLFLLDEILHGTNTTERQIAARQIIRHLLQQEALGMVSTHDLTLANSPDLEAHSHKVYFTETVTERDGQPVMSFDYQLRPGIAPSTNALMLMKLMGLPTPEDPLGTEGQG